MTASNDGGHGFLMRLQRWWGTACSYAPLEGRWCAGEPGRCAVRAGCPQGWRTPRVHRPGESRGRPVRREAL
ncbi:protein of unknown function [Streptomyces sp. KY70]|nr:protein of unknown function [Streptomyces sp. KY70]